MRMHLCSFEIAWTNAAFDALYPAPCPAPYPAPTIAPSRASAKRLPHGIASMHPARFFDAVLAGAPLEQSLGLRLTLWMIALAPLFTIRKLGTIASIAATDRARVLELLATSPSYVVRQLAMSFKAVATLLYAQSSAIRAAMTLPAPPMLTPRSALARRSHVGRAPSDTRLTEGGAHDHAAE